MREWSIALAALALAIPAWAQVEPAPGRQLRLAGEIADPPGAAPRRFVIDARLVEGDEPFQSRIEGWFASLEPVEAGAGEIEGTCVQERCAASVRLEPGKLGLTGDFAGDGGGEAQAVLTDPWSDAPARAPSAVRLTPFGEEVPGLGRLSPRGSIGSHELTDLLAWTGIDLGFSNLDDREPDVRERRGLADWQLAGGRAPSGLLLANDIEALRAEADAARRTAGWAPVPGAAWASGYPAALLAPVAGQPGRFVSPDGQAELVWALDPPMDEGAWDALVKREIADREDDEGRGYARVNDDFELTVTRGGQRLAFVWLNRPGGVARMAFRYPPDDEAFSRLEPVLIRTFRLPDDFGARE